MLCRGSANDAELRLTEGITTQATEANYQCWYNVPAGAIIVDLAWSPSYRITFMSDDEWPAGSQLPAIRQLSDVMWIEWAAQAAAGGVDAGSLKYFPDERREHGHAGRDRAGHGRRPGQ